MKLRPQALRRYFATLHPAHARIATGAAWVALFVIASKLAGAAKEMSVAWRYGVSGVVDAFQLATTLVFWLPSALVSVFSIVLVPLLVRLAPHGPGVQAQFLKELQGTAVLLGLGIGLITIVGTPLALSLLGGALSADSRETAWQFVLGLAPAAPLSVLIGVYAAQLMARGRQINTLLEGLSAVVMLLFVLLWQPGMSMAPLLLGSVLGVAAHASGLWRANRAQDGASALPSLARRSPYWPELYASVGVMALGQLIMSCIAPLDQFTAAHVGDGAIAALGYANRVVSLLLGVGAVAIARGALPVFSALQAEGRAVELRAIGDRWTVATLAAGAGVALLAWAAAPWIVRILFEHGAFTPADTQIVAEALRYGLLQVPFFFGGLVLVQLLACQGRYGVIASLAASNLAVKAFLNILLAERMGVSGITLATSLMTIWSMSCLCVAVALIRPKASQ